MHTLTRQQLVLLALITLVWGVNWPIMKFGVTGFPALTFRAICMWIGLFVLGLFVWWRRTPLRIERAHWIELAWLTVFNMLIWHALVIIALQTLSSGRAAILGYTMPVFSALVGSLWFGQRLRGRAWGGVAAAGLGVALLLWHELTNLAGKPWGVAMMLVGAATWAVGTQMLRHTRIPQPTLTISFWLTAFTTVWMSLLALVFERDAWIWPTPGIWWAILYNAVGVFAFAQVAWLSLARDLPPIASTLSVMFIPVLGVFTGAWWLGEVLHWQDWAAVALVMVAIASVLWPASAASRRMRP
ncbi:EamA family transporter [Hydrogenophaga sp. 2FB]|uniref:DMT family transporter n=1 Tax=Hydrogenophaga sp. 2FB TaxID=2502187 RepID=UPI0010F463B2|nr:EamA family transporter [Hydrogenophaga sp. 2FB]